MLLAILEKYLGETSLLNNKKESQKGYNSTKGTIKWQRARLQECYYRKRSLVQTTWRAT